MSSGGIVESPRVSSAVEVRPPLVRPRDGLQGERRRRAGGGALSVKIFLSLHVAPTATDSTARNSTLCGSNRKRASEGRCRTRLFHRPGTTRVSGRGTWQCSELGRGSAKEELKNSRRRVASASEKPISNETCCPGGTKSWNTRNGCFRPTATRREGEGGGR